MACSNKEDKDYKLPLRPWLIRKINSGKFVGLEWEPASNDLQFRLPWERKNMADSENCICIIRAWAENRGRENVEKISISMLKASFRTLLNKSVDFESLKEKSQLDKQTGNYKVYRIRKPAEIRELKMKASKIYANQPTSFGFNFDPGDSKTIEKNVETIPMETCGISDQGIDILCPVSIVRPPETVLCSAIPALAYNSNVREKGTNDVLMTEGDEGLCVDFQNSKENESIEMNAMDESNARTNVTEILRQLGIENDSIGECQVIITYDDVTVYDKILKNMEKGYRIFYGDPVNQIRLLQKHNATNEKLADYRLLEIALPPLMQPNRDMINILEQTELGIIIYYDPQTLCFKSKRLCQNHVYLYDTHGKNAQSTPIKMEKDKVMTLFHHDLYVTEYLERLCNSTGSEPPESKIILAVGTKPKSNLALQIKKGLQITIIPHVVSNLMQGYRDDSSSLSLYFSAPTYFEELLRQIRKNPITPCNLIT